MFNGKNMPKYDATVKVWVYLGWMRLLGMNDGKTILKQD